MSNKSQDNLYHWLEKSERYIYLAAGYILVVAAAGLLGLAAYELLKAIISGHYTDAAIHLLDRVLLAMMLAEIIYTVSCVAKTLQITVEPFLIVGIIAAIRRMLIITAESAGNVDLHDSHFLAALAELGLLAIMILLLAYAMRLITHRPDPNQ
ncbi:MAG TPA: hypothetical protein ENJ84_04335 [Gammaproteobacteria bacterium]|nr:hypothetical protein [Gammaproteobacteria bacterium]